MVNAGVMKNLQSLFGHLMTDLNCDEESKGPGLLARRGSTSSNSGGGLNTLRIIPALLKSEENMRNDWRSHLRFMDLFDYFRDIYDASTFEKKFVVLLEENLKNGNRMI